MEDTLPNKLSDLLELAVNDCISIENGEESGIVLNMTEWHTPGALPGTCQVCMAGAVLHKELKVPINQYFDWHSAPISVQEKMRAINNIREGFAPAGATTVRVWEALNCIKECFISTKLLRAPWGAYREAIVNLRKLEEEHDPLVIW